MAQGFGAFELLHVAKLLPVSSEVIAGCHSRFTMLNIRNISFMRRIYVWMLGLMTRIAYWGNLRNRQPAERVFPERRIRRINSELECGPAAWKDSFLAVSNRQATCEVDGNLAFRLTDLTPYVSEGVEAIVGDTLTRCFTASAPDPWNFLTRTAPVAPRNFTPYWTLLWLVGIWVRYCILLPIRTITLIIGVLVFVIFFSATFVLPKSRIVIPLRKFMIRFLCSSVVASWSGYVRFHGNRPQPRANQIYVANHTSLIDVFILVKDYNFSFIGQRHGGLAGFLEDILHTAQDHVWFDREEGQDRRSVHKLLTDHVSDGNKEPMLVFPEGTCTNSDYCIMFKKGSFELGTTVYPIAMKYRKRFGDPFWNSQTTSFPRHLYDLMTSWALVCDVYYLDPMEKGEDETGVQFSGRVRQAISEKAGLTCVNWDGFLKRHQINPKFRKQRQQALSQIVQRRISGDIPRAVSSSVLSLQERSETHQVLTGGIDTLDTLSLGKLIHEPQSLHRDEDADVEDDMENENGNGTLRRRRAGVRRSTIAGDAGLLRKAKVAARDVTKWVIGIGMFLVAGGVTWRFMPRSWITFLSQK